MRKIKLDKNFIYLNEEGQITKELIDYIIKTHEPERSRIVKLEKYYDNDNDILQRTMTDKQKPNNRIPHPYFSYITNMCVGALMGIPVSWTKKGEEGDELLEELNNVFDYNDEEDTNTSLAEKQSIGGYGVEMLYIDNNKKVRFKYLPSEEVCLIFDNTVEENLILAVRYYKQFKLGATQEEDAYTVEVYDNKNIYYYNYTEKTEGSEKKTYLLNDNKVNGFNVVQHSFIDVPFCFYANNDKLYGDAEKVKGLIDSYDKLASDRANDFEYFADAYMVITGAYIDPDDPKFKTLKENKIINFDAENGKVEFLIKDIVDTANENFANRIDKDIHKFSLVPCLTDETFGTASGEALKYKLMGFVTLLGKKQRKFKTGLMRRVELICGHYNTFKGGNYDFTQIKPQFAINLPENETEITNMIKQLEGIVSRETRLSWLSRVDDPQAENEKVQIEKKELMEGMEGYSDAFNDTSKPTENKDNTNISTNKEEAL